MEERAIGASQAHCEPAGRAASGEPGADWTLAPVEKPRGEQVTRLAFMTLIGVVTGAYLVLAPAGAGSLWVLFNVTVAYAVLQNPHKRQFYGGFFRAFREPRAWVLTLIMLVLVFGAMAVTFEVSQAGEEEATNPFVSNLVFMLAILPLIPIVAFSETLLFQGAMAKLFFPGAFEYCRHCRTVVAAGPRCPFCGLEPDPEASLQVSSRHLRQEPPTTPGGLRWAVAVVASGLLFGAAHALLIGSWLPLVLVVPGTYLAHLFLKEGYLIVTKVHLLYDYVVLGLLLVSELAEALMGLGGV